ncbi:MAG: alanine--glyoxylate aminotransferase family protein [Chloroflexota bacterium]|nr:alanine--glyoxylate aminotransferase family protein [Chloroflexota bacterium]
MQLRIPGPTPLPDEILQAMARPMINHRGPEFVEMFRGATADLKEVFQTKSDVLILTGSGTGGLEAAVVNTLSPGDEIVSLSNGVFAERFASIAEEFGARVHRIQFEWGRAVDPDEVRKALSQHTSAKTVLVTHNETSTGVTSDLQAVSAVVREFDKLLLVDAISGLGAINLPTDAWGCDVVVTGSQKGWMAPPGLAMVSVSERAWEARAAAKMPKFYWDFSRAKKYLDDRGQTPWTPGLSAVYALAAALELMKGEGLANIVARHAQVAAKTREAVKALGLSLFADEQYASNTVTAVKAPDGLDVGKLLRILREKHSVVLAGGQQRLEGKIFRIGHLGYVTEGDIDEVMAALKLALPQATS